MFFFDIFNGESVARESDRHWSQHERSFNFHRSIWLIFEIQSPKTSIIPSKTECRPAGWRSFDKVCILMHIWHRLPEYLHLACCHVKILVIDESQRGLCKVCTSFLSCNIFNNRLNIIIMIDDDFFFNSRRIFPYYAQLFRQFSVIIFPLFIILYFIIVFSCLKLIDLNPNYLFNVINITTQ